MLNLITPPETNIAREIGGWETTFLLCFGLFSRVNSLPASGRVNSFAWCEEPPPPEEVETLFAAWTLGVYVTCLWIRGTEVHCIMYYVY